MHDYEVAVDSGVQSAKKIKDTVGVEMNKKTDLKGEMGIDIILFGELL